MARRYVNDENQIGQAKTFITKNNLFTPQGHVIPLFVDWVCKIVDLPEVINIPKTSYFLTKHRIDNLLIILIQREIKKQSLNMTEDGMFKLLEEIIVHHEGQISLQGFREYIELETNDDVGKYLKNPLLSVADDTISIRYDALLNFVKTRFLYHSIINRHTSSEKIITMLRECNQGDGELFLSLSSLVADGVTLDQYKYILSHFRARYADATRSTEREDIKKCISSLLHLAMAQFKPKDRAESTNLVRELYGADQTIKNLFVFGNFHALDFNMLTVSESSFVSYTEFHKCGFPDNERPIFLYTEFKNFNIPKVNKIKRAFFDASCSFIQCNIKEIIGQTDKEHQARLNSIIKDVSILVGYIDTSMKSLNLVKRFCNISYPKGEKRLLDDLIKIGFIEREKAKGDLMYKINSVYYDELPAIKLGRLPSELIDHLKILLV